MDSMVDYFAQRKGDYLAKNATPIYCSEVLMTSLANELVELTKAPVNETPDEAMQRIAYALDYTKILQYMLSMMQQEVYPAIKRLHLLQYPEDSADKKEDVAE